MSLSPSSFDHSYCSFFILYIFITKHKIKYRSKIYFSITMDRIILKYTNSFFGSMKRLFLYRDRLNFLEILWSIDEVIY